MILENLEIWNPKQFKTENIKMEIRSAQHICKVLMSGNKTPRPIWNNVRSIFHALKTYKLCDVFVHSSWWPNRVLFARFRVTASVFLLQTPALHAVFHESLRVLGLIVTGSTVVPFSTAGLTVVDIFLDTNSCHQWIAARAATAKLLLRDPTVEIRRPLQRPHMKKFA